MKITTVYLPTSKGLVQRYHAEQKPFGAVVGHTREYAIYKMFQVITKPFN